MAKDVSTSAAVTLFGIYFDELLMRLSHSGHGCVIGHLYYGAVG